MFFFFRAMYSAFERMDFTKLIILVVISLSLTATATVRRMNTLMFARSVGFRESVTCSANATSSTRYAIIIHGWRESCQVDWVLELARNLRDYRGGCIICMDYSLLAKTPNYLYLAKNSDELATLLRDKLRELERRGYDPNNGFMFGFSLGGRIALEGGRMYGRQKIAEIDVCDNAGPGFDIFEQPDSKDAAQNVQCIHTSRDKGTRIRDCHQDWNMGFCGRRQMAASSPPRGSHGLCPIFYNAAFNFDFYAEVVPRQCRRASAYHNFWPIDFRMGYMERRKFQMTGEFYASTTNEYPFTPHVGSMEDISDVEEYRRRVRRIRKRNRKFKWGKAYVV